MVRGESFTCVCKEGWEGPTCTESECSFSGKAGQLLLLNHDKPPACYHSTPISDYILLSLILILNIKTPLLSLAAVGYQQKRRR